MKEKTNKEIKEEIRLQLHSALGEISNVAFGQLEDIDQSADCRAVHSRLQLCEKLLAQLK